MSLLAIIAIVASALLAINVGGNNSAAEMGPAFGSGIRSKREAVILIAVFSMIGAMIAGREVVHTIGKGIMDGHVLQTDFRYVIIIIVSATAVIALANVLHVPVATSHAMVGAVVGMGLFHGFVNWHNVGRIVVWWLITPTAALAISYALGSTVYDRLAPRVGGAASSRFYRAFVTLSGCYMAFSAGSNSLAKAVGPLVGAGIMNTNGASVMGGLGMAFGALLVGHRLLHTVGKGITPLDPLKATMVELVCGSILLVSSCSGVPVSLAETVTCSVIGFSCAHAGFRTTLQNKNVRTIYKLWPVCPVFTAAASFGLAWLVQKFAGA